MKSSSHRHTTAENAIPTTDSGALLSAASFAAEKHRDQRRKGSRDTPYINHPLDVAERLSRVGVIDDVAVLVAAILHDTVEDTDTTVAEIEVKFGPEVASLVSELTVDGFGDFDDPEAPEIVEAARLSHKAKVIRLADKMSNLSDIISNPPSRWSAKRLNAYLVFTQRIAQACRGENAALDAEFDRVHREACRRLPKG